MKRLTAMLRRVAIPGRSKSTAGLLPGAEPEAESESAPAPKSPVRNYSTLERLPPEIRRYILSVLELPGLRTLVHASPTFHKQYLYDRGYLLRQSLGVTLGSVFIDAYAVQKSRDRNRSAVRDRWGGTNLSDDTKQIITELMTSHPGKESWSPLARSVTQEEVQSMVVFYCRMVNPVMELFARRTQDSLAKELVGDLEHQEQVKEVTCAERMRFTRATYRFQLLCQLGDPSGLGQHREKSIQAFFNLIEAWEVEEIYSFYLFAQSVYDKIFTDITSDLHPDNPRFDAYDRAPTPPGAFDSQFTSKSAIISRSQTHLTLVDYRDIYLQGTALAGSLPLLSAVLFEIKDHEQLVTTMQQSIVGSRLSIETEHGILDDEHQQERRATDPSERDQMREDRAPFPFVGDGGGDGPPFAWTIIWAGTYSNLYGSYIPDTIRRWGYVFWDRATLKYSARELLEEQWDDACCLPPGDPRDYVY